MVILQPGHPARRVCRSGWRDFGDEAQGIVAAGDRADRAVGAAGADQARRRPVRNAHNNKELMQSGNDAKFIIDSGVL